MKRLFRVGFAAVALVFWLVVLALGLEVWERWRWERVGKTNPFVLSRVRQTGWPLAAPDDFSPELTDPALRAARRGAGQSAQPDQPVPDDRVLLANRAAHFQRLAHWERFIVCDIYRVSAWLTDGRGNVDKAYSESDYTGGKVLDAFVPAADASRLTGLVQSVAAGGAPAFVEAGNPAQGPPWYYVAQCDDPGEKMAGAKGEPPYALVLAPRPAPATEASPESLWDVDFYSYKPHTRRADQRNVLGVLEDFQVNNLGLRDDDVILPKPAGVRRIVCIGASTTEEGPTNDVTYPNILEALLNEHDGANRYDVVNAGVSGMNSLKHKFKTADYLALQPDVAVIYNAVNDICHDLFPMWIKDAPPLKKRLRESQFVNMWFNGRLMPDEAQMAADIRASKISNLRAIAEILRGAGVKVIFCTFAAPDPGALTRDERNYYEYYTRREWGGRYAGFASYLCALRVFNREIEALARELGAPCIPVAEEVTGGTAVFGDICHMKNRGIEKKARVIMRHLLPLLEDTAEAGVS